jgi:hypothetical protein
LGGRRILSRQRHRDKNEKSDSKAYGSATQHGFGSGTPI